MRTVRQQKDSLKSIHSNEYNLLTTQLEYCTDKTISKLDRIDNKTKGNSMLESITEVEVKCDCCQKILPVGTKVEKLFDSVFCTPCVDSLENVLLGQAE